MGARRPAAIIASRRSAQLRNADFELLERFAVAPSHAIAPPEAAWTSRSPTIVLPTSLVGLLFHLLSSACCAIDACMVASVEIRFFRLAVLVLELARTSSGIDEEDDMAAGDLVGEEASEPLGG